MRDLTGYKLGDYEVLSEIGRGAMGVVYKARQYSLDRTVALKILSPLFAADEGYVERFKREGTIMASITHTNIVSVYEAGSHLDLDNGERLHYFVMEYVEGETVQSRLKRQGILAPDEAVAIAVHVAQGLECAWNKARVIHRDIKPSNIFLSSEGHVKIGDLGLARCAGDMQASASLTATGGMVGTAYYMSPEQARGERDIDFRADIYSLGCTLYRMLSGRHVYEGPFASVIVKHLTEPPPSLRMVSPDCPVDLTKLIEKMLAKHPSGRHQHYDELIAELRSVYELLTEPKAAAPENLPPPKKKSAAMVYGIAAMAAVTVIASLLVWAPWKQHSESLRPASSNAQQRLSRQATKPPPPVVTLEKKETEAKQPAATNIAVAFPTQEPPKKEPKATETEKPVAVVAVATPIPVQTNATPPATDASQMPSTNAPSAPPAPAQVTASATTAPIQSPKSEIQTSADDAFLKSVSAMQPEQQVQAVIAKLKELNLNFDGKETHKIEGGAVTMLAFSTVGVTDISPVKVLRWLRTLNIVPPAINQKGSLANLSPLNGLKLSWLWCHNNPITDLTPLKSMPLTVLSFGGTQVSDLAPLFGMNLQVLSFNDTAVDSLSLLAGMPLTVLWCNNTKVGDLTPLNAMPLREIKCDFVAERDAGVLRSIRTLTKINDQPVGVFWMRFGLLPQTAAAGRRPFAGAEETARMPNTSGSVDLVKEQMRRFENNLKTLNPDWDGNVKYVSKGRNIVQLSFSTEGVTNIAPVSAIMTVKVLHCSPPDPDSNQGSLSDLTPLAVFKQLDFLRCEGNPISDLKPLFGMKLEHLDISNSEVSDLRPLSGMKLESLDISNTRVKDLKPLSGTTLGNCILNIANTEVSDLTPLMGLKFYSLNISNTRVTDLRPLSAVLLVGLDISGTEIRDLKPLSKINFHWIDLRSTPVSDLTPLQGITNDGVDIYLDKSDVRDLSPLTGMKLRVLSCNSNGVIDLTPLKRVKVKKFQCTGTKITDLSPFKNVGLTHIRLDFNSKDHMKILRSITTLEEINGLTADEFWKRADAGEAPQP